MSGEIILTQADGLLDGRIKYGDGTTQFYYESPVLSLGEPEIGLRHPMSPI